MDRRLFFKSLLASGVSLCAQRDLRGQGMASRGIPPAPRPEFSGRPWEVTFTDVAPHSGLIHPIVYGEEFVKRYIFEANGPGIAFYDFDNDGWLDVFVPSGTLRGGIPTGQQAPTNRLYRNNRNGTFTDVTARSGLTETGWCYGVCVGDYDNDGHDDLFLTFYGKNILYHNNGDGTFTDVTRKAGLEESRTRFSTGCTFVDYDRDGRLDLFVSRYIDLDLKSTPVGGQRRACQFEGIPIACGPIGLPKETCSLYRNNGDGTFTEVTHESGIDKAGGRYGLSAVALDYNNDGWPDIFVACDSSPNLLFRNNKDGTFADIAMEAGCAVNGDGQEQSGMGVGIGDYDADGYLDLFLPHFSGDTPILYRNVRGEYFDDLTYSSGLAINTQYVCWGVGFVDLDNDGWLDIFHVTGSVYPEVEKVHKDYKFMTQRVVYRNLGNGQFEEVSSLCGAPVLASHSSRGCAFGDFDNDGNQDVLILNMSEPPSLLKNNNSSGNRWLVIKAVGTHSNRSAIGARITVTAGRRRQIREVMSGSSYISQSDLRQHFGLGKTTKADEIEVRWPSGHVDRISGVNTNQFISIEEGRGLVRSQAYNS
ncbi:MAG: CRTAC1 family protein [Acidobacteria bacterium]|nr:MAG: CRTAC1 family protein [Acidobacteriota bacterium]